MSRFDEFSETELVVLRRALDHSGKSMGWKKDEIKSLDEMLQEVRSHKTLKSGRGEDE